MTNKIRLPALFLLLLFKIGESQSIIKTLPGYSGTLPIKLETGYIEVGENDEVQLFYYFIESESSPRQDPLLIWFTGGPGCSGLSALLYEIGPLTFDIANFDGSLPSILLNPYSWTKVANIIFLDSPAGTGFSYSNTSQGYSSSDTKSAKDNYMFLRKVMKQDCNHECLSKVLLELKQGYITGNAKTDQNIENNAQVPYAHRMALISHEYFEAAKLSCNGEYDNPDPNNLQCLLALLPIHESQHYETSYVWANDPTVQEALHVRKGTILGWTRCNRSLSYEMNVQSVVQYHKLLSNKGYPALVYSGDHDMSVPYTSTLKWIRSLNMTVHDNWRPWVVNGQVAGYTEKYKNNEFYLTFVTVKGAGHTAPEYKPRECFAMLDRWLSLYAL